MNFCWVTLPVKDLDSSLDFYHGILGLPVASREKNHGVDLAMLGAVDQPKIELIQGFNGKESVFRSDITVGVMVESLDEAMALMEKHQIKLSRGPISPNPRIRFVFYYDPDGYEVQLVETRNPASR